jgi:hypothetical protein
MNVIVGYVRVADTKHITFPLLEKILGQKHYNVDSVLRIVIT